METYEKQKLLQKALNWAYFYLKFRSRTRKELVIYLTKKAEKYSLPQEIIEAALKELEEQHLINDAEFIQRYIDSKIHAKPKGERALRNELQRLGVEKELLDAHFDKNPSNDDKLALKALQSRWPRYALLDKQKRFEKTAGFLSRRGFSFDVIKKTIAEMEEKE